MKNYIFNGVYLIRIFDFLTRLVNEADKLNMSEAQAYVALPTFLGDPTETEFRTSLSGGSSHGSVTCWPEAIRYLLRTYARPTEMREALKNIRPIHQRDE